MLTLSAQLTLDLRQQKDALEASAASFIDSIAPLASNTAYNFYREDTARAIEGLFTQKAIHYV